MIKISVVTLTSGTFRTVPARVKVKMR